MGEITVVNGKIQYKIDPFDLDLLIDWLIQTISFSYPQRVNLDPDQGAGEYLCTK